MTASFSVASQGVAPTVLKFPGSDEDVRGIYMVPSAAYLPIDREPVQLSDDRNNTVYYSLRRCIELLAEANPNVLELLFSPQDCVQIVSPEMEQLVLARSIFVTRQCGDTHIGYATSQIKKARGQNKWVNNPKPPAAPRKEEFCYVIPKARLSPSDSPPCRPVPLNQIGWELEQYHAARLEHVPDTYRLYHYGGNARGTFRGDVLVCESIPEADEANRFAGLLIFNEHAWKQSFTEHQNYWDWRKNRNDARWEQQEAGQLDYDAKNMMHTVRLLISGRSILERGEPMVRFGGKDLSLLLDIRAGKLGFEQIRLFSKCNLALNEWLGSPVVYFEASGFRSELRALIPTFFNPTRATHHYRSMAKQALSNLTSENQISIKKLLYATRALLACRWIQQHKSQPPTEFHVIVEHVASIDERTYLADLIARKSDTPEKGEIVLEPNRGKAIGAELETYERNMPPDVSPKTSCDLLDATLRRWIGGVS